MDQCHHGDVSRDAYCGMMSWQIAEDIHCVRFYVMISLVSPQFLVLLWLKLLVVFSFHVSLSSRRFSTELPLFLYRTFTCCTAFVPSSCYRHAPWIPSLTAWVDIFRVVCILWAVYTLSWPSCMLLLFAHHACLSYVSSIYATQYLRNTFRRWHGIYAPRMWPY